MRKVFRLGVLPAAFVFFTACSDGPVAVQQNGLDVITSAAYDVGEGDLIPLVAGQFTQVGTVELNGNPADGTFQITYDITEAGWCITETHWHVADEQAGIPQNNKGNPKIGHFMGGGSEDCVTNVTYDWPDPISGGDPWYVAAHAVVGYGEGAGGAGVEDILFGVQDLADNGDGDLYEINPVDGTLTLLADFEDMAPTDNFSPNGLATDRTNQRLYFSVNNGTGGGGENDKGSDLYYYDLVGGGAPVMAASFADFAIYSATMDLAGIYYFVDNHTDNLWQVAFDGAGINGSELPKCVGFWGEGGTELNFGDIVERDGFIYGVARPTGGAVHFFVIDLSDCSTQLFNRETDGDTPYDYLLQLAFSSGGTLFAQRAISAGGLGEWYELDPADGDIVQFLFQPEATFTDVSSGIRIEEPPPELEYETAWGMGGYDFTRNGGNSGGSWAQYIKYVYGGGD